MKINKVWFVRGVFLGLIVLIAVLLLIKPTISTAQIGVNPNAEPLQDINDLSSGQRTDDPLGRVFIPLDSSNKETSGLNNRPIYQDPDQNQLEVDNSLSAGFLQTAPLMIPAADFRSDGVDPDSYYFYISGGYLQGGNTNTCLMAPAYLPNHANVSQIYATVVDNDANYRIWLRLLRVGNFDGIVTEMGSMGTTNEYSSQELYQLSDSTITSAEVVFPDYSYYVCTCLESANVKLYSVYINFE